MNPIKLYRKSQEVQLNWIRQHPVQYVALNAIVLAAFWGYMMHKDNQEFGEIELEEIETTP